MEQDFRRVTLITARKIHRQMSLRQVETAMKNAGVPVSRQTICNLENDYRIDTRPEVKEALKQILGLDTFPEGPVNAVTAGDQHGSG